MFEFRGSAAPHRHTHIRVDAMWRRLLCNQAQWVMRGRNALLWWLEEEEARLGKDWRRQSDPLAKSSGRGREGGRTFGLRPRLDCQWLSGPRTTSEAWIHLSPGAGTTPDREKHMCTESHANTHMCTTSNEWKMTQCDRRRLSVAAGWNKPSSSFDGKNIKNALERSKLYVALKSRPTGIKHNMCQVRNYTLFDFVCVCAWCILCDCYIDFPLALGAICFQRCVGSSVCMRLCARQWYLSRTPEPSAHTHFARCRTCLDSGCASAAVLSSKEANSQPLI